MADVAGTPLRTAARTGESRLAWLDVMRIMMILEIIGFHWVRTSQENPAFGLFSSPGYENVGTGFGQLQYLITDRSGFGVSSFLNNLINIVFGYGWQAVNMFVLLSGVGLALSYRPTKAGFSLLGWYRRRYARILVPYYLIAIPMVLAGELLKIEGTGRGGLLGSLAEKLAIKNLPDPVWIELLKHVFLIDPRQDFWICYFFSPAWWFIPPVLVAYLVFPLLHAAITRFGLARVLVVAYPVTVAAYSLTAAGLLMEHGAYFIILHEAFNFVLGIGLGRMLQDEAGRARIVRFVRSPNALVTGSLLFVLGNFLSWFFPSHPFASPVFTTGLSLVLAWVAFHVARLRLIAAWVSRIDVYNVYLLHQWLAFPLVAVVVALLGSRAQEVGFSTGFVAFVILTFATVALFERVQKLWSNARPSATSRLQTPRLQRTDA